MTLIFSAIAAPVAWTVVVYPRTHPQPMGSARRGGVEWVTKRLNQKDVSPPSLLRSARAGNAGNRIPHRHAREAGRTRSRQGGRPGPYHGDTRRAPRRG